MGLVTGSAGRHIKWGVEAIGMKEWYAGKSAMPCGSHLSHRSFRRRRALCGRLMSLVLECSVYPSADTGDYLTILEIARKILVVGE